MGQDRRICSLLLGALKRLKFPGVEIFVGTKLTQHEAGKDSPGRRKETKTWCSMLSGMKRVIITLKVEKELVVSCLLAAQYFNNSVKKINQSYCSTHCNTAQIGSWCTGHDSRCPYTTYILRYIRNFVCWGEKWQNKDRLQLYCNKTVLD